MTSCTLSSQAQSQSEPTLGHDVHSFLNEANRIANQAGRLSIHGDQYNYLYVRKAVTFDLLKTDAASGERSPHPAGVTRPSRRVSVPFTTVSTYGRRPRLSEELRDKPEKPHRGTGFAHAVAVAGLGGTGKTQLVLRYIEEHAEEYDTVLWIDVRNEETARVSYERCCRMLGLPLEPTTSDGPLRDVPAVQTVFPWLRTRAKDKRWLAIVDNVDDLTWDVGSIVPKGRAGSVIVTSQDAQASRLLGERTRTVRVNAMERGEAVNLLLNYLDGAIGEGDSCWALIVDITERLDRLALEMDLAGARVRVDTDNGDDAADALRQYISDYQQYQDKLLLDEDFTNASTYKKTVWTACEASLASLKKQEDSRKGVCPIQLLSFMTQLDRANIQDELFGLAKVNFRMEEWSNRLGIKMPLWMQSILGIVADGRWDNYSYRATAKSLLRYGLVRRVGESWKGLTMHGLVRWRASAGTELDQYRRLHLALMAAVCEIQGQDSDVIPFRRHIHVHLPEQERLLNPSGVEVEGLRWMWSCIGGVLDNEGRWKEAEELFLKVIEANSGVLGEEHPDTLTAIANLAHAKKSLGQDEIAVDLMKRSFTASLKALQ